MLMVQAIEKTITLEEFLKLPKTKPTSEYIEGEIIQKLIPQGKHSIIQGELLTTINLIAKNQQSAYAFSELRCTFGGCSVLANVAVLCWGKISCDENGEI